MPRISHKLDGFTLIELLVVIAIIAILAAILFPTFTAVKARGQEAACSSNTQQIGRAMMMYMQDTDGKFPDPRSIGLTATSSLPEMGLWCMGYTGVASRLPKYLGSSKSACSKTFYCPANPNGKAFSPFTNTTVPMGSVPTRPFVGYCYRYCLTVYTLQMKGFRESDCSRPSKQVMFNELAAWHHGKHSAWQQSPKNSNPLSPFTGQPLVNAIYIDGHAKLWKVPYITADNSPGSGPDDWPYDVTWFTIGPGGPLNGDKHGTDPNVFDPRKSWDR